MTDSQTLLADYVKNGSEPAFRELVNGYLNLVYSTALRLVEGDTHLAEDVAQTVFVDLARMARTFSSEVMLGGWLHRHTCFVAANAMRSERRRRARERQAVEMNTLQNDSPANFALVAPLLDQAINALGEEDRKAILLRFFEQRDFRSLGLALGSTEDAARMRVNRALEKLEHGLKQRGVTTTATALSTALLASAAQAAPAGLAATISSAALAGTTLATTATLTTAKALAMTTFEKMLITAVLVATVSTGIFKAYKGSQTPREPTRSNAVAESKTADTTESTRQNASYLAPISRPAPSDPQPLAGAIAALRAALYAPPPPPLGTHSYPPNDVAQAILGFGAYRKDAFDVLKEAANDPTNVEASRRAVSAMGLVGRSPVPQIGLVGEPAPEAKSFLWTILMNDTNREDLSLGSLALTSLWGIGFNPDQIPALSDLLAKTNNGQLKRYIPEAIAKTIQDNSDAAVPYVPVVESLLTNSNSEVQFEAACALAKYEAANNPAILKKLSDGLKSGDLQKVMALETLQTLGSTAQPALQAVWDFANTTDDTVLREVAYKTMGKIDGELRKTIPAVDEAMKADDMPPSTLNTTLDRDSQALEANPEDASEKRFVSAIMADAKIYCMGAVVYAMENQGHFPTNQDEALRYYSSTQNPPSGTNQFDILYHGFYHGSLQPNSTTHEIIVIRSQAWQGSDGKWNRVYGFADGHCEVHSEANEDFSDWERQHAAATLARH